MKLKIIKIDKTKPAFIEVVVGEKIEISGDVEIDIPPSTPIQSFNCEPEQGIKPQEWRGIWRPVCHVCSRTIKECLESEETTGLPCDLQKPWCDKL